MGLHHLKRKKSVDPMLIVRNVLVGAALNNETEKLKEACQILCDNGVRLKDLGFSPAYFQLIGDKIIESGFQPK